jgi:N-acetylneuraminic acid mutarotase
MQLAAYFPTAQSNLSPCILYTYAFAHKVTRPEIMAKKDTKSKAAEKKARTAAKAAKQTKKATQKEKKLGSKDANDSDEDVDLDAVLEAYAKQQEQFLKVTETACEPPPARASATLLGSPSNSNELFLFGGEYYNGALATFYNDLYIYLINKGEWRKVTSPNSPLPRSGHAWCRGGNAGGVYLFGGEFSSPKQGTFYHYNDFWKLETSSREWTRIEGKGKSPPARSGHRMTYYKNYIILFGGFQDTSQQTKYLQDIWLYDTSNFLWHNPVLPPATQKPDARSSFTFLPHDSGAVLFGGYSRTKAVVPGGKHPKGAAVKTKSAALKPKVHDDTWFLRIVPPAPEALETTPPTIRWEKRKKPANSPNPARAGATMAFHKGRGMMFGGVHDVEESEEGIDSEFFDTLYTWNIDRNRFFPVALRRPRQTQAKKQGGSERGNARRGRGKADEEELLKNLAALEAKGSIVDSDAMDVDITEEQEEPVAKLDQPVSMTMPHPRFNTQLAVQDDVLYMFGGTYEHGDREYTFDEMYAIDLIKLDGVKQIFHRELENWVGSDDEEDSGSEDDEDDSEDEDMEDGESGGVKIPTAAKDDVASTTTTAVDEDMQSEPTLVETEAEPTIVDTRPHPRPFESLREFFVRTTDAWQDILLEVLRQKNSDLNKSIKELRKEAFEIAETKWWDCREEITALEDEQEEAGIGEVVSLADKATESGVAGRRR